MSRFSIKYHHRKLLSPVKAGPLRACLSLFRTRKRILFGVVLGGLAAVAITTVALSEHPVSAAPSDSAEACAAAGGTWKNLAPTGGVPEMGCVITWTTEKSPTDRAKLYSHYNAAAACVNQSMKNSIKTVAGGNGATSPSQGEKNRPSGVTGWDYEWFNDSGAYGYAYPDGKKDCYQIMQGLIDVAGFSDGKALLDAMGFTFDASVPRWNTPSTDGGARESRFRNAVLSQIGVSSMDSLYDNPVKYVIYYNAFTDGGMSECSASKKMTYASADSTLKQWADEESVHDGATYTKVTLVEGNKTVEYIYSYEPGTSGSRGASQTNYGAQWSWKEDWKGSASGRFNNKTCAELPALISDTAAAYKKWVELHPDVSVETPGAETPGSTDAETSSCAIDGIGYIICPTVNFLAGLADNAYAFLADNFLSVDVKLFKADASNPTFTAWQRFLAFANVFLVIAFIVIIYSQLTGAEVSNYGLKKLLPKIIIAAVLINLSFFICQALIDLSNLLGYGLKSLLTSLAPGTTDAAINVAGADATGEGWTGLAGTVLLGGAVAAGGAAAAGGITLGLVALLGMLIAAVIALIMIFFILVIRQVLIVLLIVLAPLAFAAYLLPNTEQWFTKWRKTFVALLMVFPVIGIVFGASTLASAVVGDIYKGTDNVLGQVVAAGILVIPLFVVPGLLRKSIDAVGGIGGRLSGVGSKLGGKAQGGIKNSKFAKHQEGLARIRSAQRSAGTYKGRGGAFNPGNWRSGISRRLNASDTYNKVTGGYGSKLANQGYALANKEETEAVSNAEQALRRASISDPNAAVATLQAALASGDAVQAKAAQNVLFSQGSSGMNKFHDIVSAAESAGTAHSTAVGALRENINTNHGQLVKNKAADVSKWAATGGTIQSHTENAETWSGLSQADMAGQTGASLARAQPHLDANTAGALLKNKNLSGTLDPAQQAALRGAGGGQAAANSQEASPVEEPMPQAEQSGRPSGVPPAVQPVDAAPQRPGGQGSSREQVEQALAQASEGSSGSTVFTVSHSDEVAPQTNQEAEGAARVVESTPKVVDRRAGGSSRDSRWLK